MNDFSKEELQEIEQSLIFKMDKFVPTPGKVTHDLVDKIQSMIDNYCENNRVYIVSGHDGADLHIDKVFACRGGALKYKRECESYDDGENVFSIQEHILIKKVKNV